MLPQTLLLSSPSLAASFSSPSSSSSSSSSSPPSAAAAAALDPHRHQQQHQLPFQPQYPLDHPQLQQQHLLQQRLLLQQQQQQAQLQLQLLQLRQKQRLQEEYQEQLQRHHRRPHSLEHRSASSSLSPATQPPSDPLDFVPTQSPLAPATAPFPPQQPPQPQPHQLLSQSFVHPFLGTSSNKTGPPKLISASVPTTASMDILAMAPFPMHQHQTFASNLPVLQQPVQQITGLPIQAQQQQQQKVQQRQQAFSNNNPFYHPLKYETGQSQESQLTINMTNVSMDTTSAGLVALPGSTLARNGVDGNQANGWIRHEHAMLNGGSSLFGTNTDDLLRRLSHSSGASDMSIQSSGFSPETQMAGYTLDAWIIQKKDQMEEISPTGGIIQAPAVQEVRTGQQFLIKLQLNKQGSPAQSSTKYPAMRVDRREAINTAGEPRAGAEPLTLQIIVHLAKSRQVRKGACAKCCHKYGPSSPILVLLDPLSPSVTDPSSYAHLDTTTGSVTILAKVICSSTDHGERGNKDRYLFEFRLRRTSSVLNNVTKMNISPLGADSREDDADTIASCYTAPIMCSGHHKAKRVYPNQRPSKVTKDGPMPKTKVVKRQKDIPSLADQIQTSQLFPSRQDEFLRSGSTSSSSTYPSPLSFMQDNVPGASAMSNFGDDQPSDLEFGTSTIGNQQLLNSTDNNILDPSQPLQPQPPRIFEVRPDHGPIRKITDVVLRGLFFRDGMVPYFGCFPAQDIVVETSNLIICKAPDSPLPGTVSITIYDSVGNTFVDLSQFTYTDDSETELLILQLQLRLAHRALEYLHSQATGQKGSANDILNSIPGLASASPRSPLGGNVMSDSADHMDDSTILTLDQVEEGILKTLDQLPAGFDISMPLDDQGNLLHLSILLGLDRLTMRLIEEGCELEALDTWGMTPLMYAVVKESELVVRSLVLAGATSSGAKTPKDFYNFLPRPVTPTRAVVGYLSVCCERYSKTLRTLVLGNTLGQPNLVQIEHEGTLESSESESDSEEQAEEEKGDAAVASQVTDENAPVIVGTAPKEVGAGMTPAASVEGSEDNTLAQLAQTLRGVHLTHDMPPLYQQDLPPMHVVGSDGSITVNMKVLKGDEIPRGVPGIQTITTDNEESGYHSGVYSEVQDRLSLLNKALLPSDGLKMTVAFHRAASSTPVSPAGVEIPTPENLFRTGDNFNIEIRLTTTVVPGVEYIPLPREFLGIRFPREMVKRVNGRPVSILNEMTYILRASIELGTRNTMVKASSSEVHQHQGDGIELKGACNNCAKYLHENKKVSPSRVSREDPTAYPILQFSVPAPVNPMQQAMLEDLDYNAEVMELHNGHVEVKARVNCSSLHHLVQREKARRAAELALPSSSSASSSSTPSTSASTVATGKAALGAKDLEDPGFVFMFELVHPTLNRVVAKFETGPFLFQSYSLKRRT